MSAKCIFIEPSDVWLFRDGHPFAPNERGRAVSLFPPTPQTMQGVIRSARLAHSQEPFDYRNWSDALKSEIGQPDNFGALSLRGPLVAKRQGSSVQRLFPLPLDVTKLQDGWHILAPSLASDFKTNWQPATLQPLLPPDGREPTKFDMGWLDEIEFLTYLRGGSLTDTSMTKTDSLYRHEARFGVQIDSRPKRPPEGMLYQIEFIRLEDGVGLFIEVGGVSLPDAGLLQMGGEARTGRYEKVMAPLGLPREGRTLPVVENRLHLKLYFATPAIFNNGWLPEWLDPKSLRGRCNGLEVKLISAAVGRSQRIGGRDISQRDRQRPVRQAVPAGSVYFFETEATADDVFQTFDGQCVSDADAQIGFGLCFVGGWGNV
jgi:CRISPR-associated protein Cmr3